MSRTSSSCQSKSKRKKSLYPLQKLMKKNSEYWISNSMDKNQVEKSVEDDELMKMMNRMHRYVCWCSHPMYFDTAFFQYTCQCLDRSSEDFSIKVKIQSNSIFQSRWRIQNISTEIIMSDYVQILNVPMILNKVQRDFIKKNMTIDEVHPSFHQVIVKTI